MKLTAFFSSMQTIRGNHEEQDACNKEDKSSVVIWLNRTLQLRAQVKPFESTSF